ncbi:MAG TPA: alkaline phosphatase family protein, partial [Armatimonadota bacterium]|nr:alkaline phosphatase family protein [Armatimonadota bacterium]
CMATSKDPGQLGLYGFRNRVDHSYTGLSIGTSLSVREPTLWDIAGASGLSSAVVGVPMTYPPKPLRGWLVSCFLTPSTQSGYTYPKTLRDEIATVAPDYRVDVEEFRTEDKHGLLRQLYDVTSGHFRVVEHLMATKSWDLFWFVEMGTDRLYHGFWRYFADDHRLFEPGNPFEQAALEYHVYLDQRIGAVLKHVDDDTLVLVVSDHGAASMVGGIAINDWLIREGHLVLRRPAESPRRLTADDVDWARTTAWGEGGYYGRIMLNVRGREPEGLVDPNEYERVRDEIARGLESLGDDQGQPMGTRALKPEDVYRQVRGIPPDLIVYFGNLRWRSVGTVGNPGVHVFDNDTGPDDANHAEEGLLIIHDPWDPRPGELQGATLYDVAPTVLERLGLPVPADMIGRPLSW